MEFMWDHQTALFLIQKYREHECLWDPRFPDHKSRRKRADTLNSIAKLIGTNSIEIERKLKNLTSHYFREKKRYEESGKTRESKWFAYKAMDFLREKYKNDEQTDDQTMEPELAEDTDASNLEPEPSRADHQRSSTLLPTTSTEPAATKRRHDSVKSTKIKHQRIANNPVKRPQRPAEDDECNLFGKLIAKKLRRLSVDKRDLIMIKISELIYLESKDQRPNSSSSMMSQHYSSASPLSTDQDTKMTTEVFIKTEPEIF